MQAATTPTATTPMPASETTAQTSSALTEQNFATQLNLRGKGDLPAFAQAVKEVCGLDLPLRVNSANIDWEHGIQILCLGPDEWLLRSEQEQADWETNLRARCTASLEATGDAFSLVDISHGMESFIVKDTAADEWLQRGCPLDLHPRVFGRGSLAQSHIGKANVIIVCAQPAHEYILSVRSSFAAYLQAWLKAAQG